MCVCLQVCAAGREAASSQRWTPHMTFYRVSNQYCASVLPFELQPELGLLKACGQPQSRKERGFTVGRRSPWGGDKNGTKPTGSCHLFVMTSSSPSTLESGFFVGKSRRLDRLSAFSISHHCYLYVITCLYGVISHLLGTVTYIPRWVHWNRCACLICCNIS